MKLIHLPTGEEFKVSDELTYYSDDFIRAEIPEYFRVEGYDKSWEWSGNQGMQWSWVIYDRKGFYIADNCKNLEEISRAEFEHHIYNPWKREQLKATGITSEDYRKLELEDLRVEAEKMGYELVRKHKDVSWCGHKLWLNYSFKNQDGGWVLHIGCPDTREGIQMPEEDIPTLIEKWNELNK